MKGNAIRLSVALVALSLLASVTAPPAYASPRWSDWSAPVPLSELNTAAGDGSPVVSRDGLTLYFASNRIGGSGAIDMWVAYRASTDAAWEAPVNLGVTINSAADDFGPALSRDGHWLFFHSVRPGGAGAADLYASYRTHTHEDFGPNGWQPAEPLVSLNTAAAEALPSYLQDDETGRSYLFFNSNRTGTLGLNDIWMAEHLADGSFGPASNVTALNSTFAEQRPTVSHDGLEIIFMSNRGGNQDLWSATRDSTQAEWSSPTPITSVNSAAIDGYAGLSPDGQTLYFARSPGPLDGFDIYVSTRTKETGKP